MFYKHVRMNHTYVFSGCDDAYFHVAWSHRQRPLYSRSPFPRHRYEGLISSGPCVRFGPLCPDSFEILDENTQNALIMIDVKGGY